MMIVSRRPAVAALSLSASVLSPVSVAAQGIGPPPGTEVLFWVFIGVASLFVLVLSTVLFSIGKKVLFKDRRPSRMEKLGLFSASVVASLVAGIIVVIALDIR